MSRLAPFAGLTCLALAVLLPLSAADPERDFSGRWVLDPGAVPGAAPEQRLAVEQNDAIIRCHASKPDGSQREWLFALNGDESRYKFGAESRNSVVKWEGAALLVNTLVSGAGSYTVMDRWRLSPDRSALNITRQIVGASGQSEYKLVYHREGQATSGTPPPDRLR